MDMVRALRYDREIGEPKWARNEFEMDDEGPDLEMDQQ